MKNKNSLGFWKAFSALGVFLAAWITASPAFAILGQPVPGALGFQESATPMKEQMAHFHDKLLLPIMTAIVIFVFLLLAYVIVRFNAKANPVPSQATHNVLLEIMWTLVPVLVLIVIAIPSMKMLYYTDRTHDAEMTLKVTGYQWYWGYEYPDNGGINFLANIVPDNELKEGQPRLLATDNAVVLPVDTNIKLLFTASDVIHSWAVPAFGVKLDAIPGKLNETWVRIEKEGTFYGQCSEICGDRHGFMPIEVHAVSKQEFAEWVKKQGGTMQADKTAPAATTQEKK